MFFKCCTPAFLVLLLASYLGKPVYAEPVTIVTEHWAPYVFVGNDGEIVGTMTQRIRAIMAHTDLDYTLSLYPWPRSYKIAQTKKNVLIYPIYKTEERLGMFHFVCPLSENIGLYLFKLSSRDDIKITKVEDAKKYRIGLIRDDYDHALLLEYGFEDDKQLDVNVDDNGSLKKLLKGRVDLMTQSLTGMNLLLDQHNISHNRLKAAYKIETDNAQSCLAMSLQTNHSIVERVQKALNHLNKTQTILKLE